MTGDAPSSFDLTSVVLKVSKPKVCNIEALICEGRSTDLHKAAITIMMVGYYDDCQALLAC